MRYLLVLLPTVLASVLYAQGDLVYPHTGTLPIQNGRVSLTDTLVGLGPDADLVFKRVVNWVEFKCPTSTNFTFGGNGFAPSYNDYRVGTLPTSAKRSSHIQKVIADERQIICTAWLPYLSPSSGSGQAKAIGYHLLRLSMQVLAEGHLVRTITHLEAVEQLENADVPGMPKTKSTTWPIVRERYFFTKLGERKPEWVRQKKEYALFGAQLQELLNAIRQEVAKP